MSVVLSCILICCDSEVEKGNSVLHTITAILNQDLHNFELILVENSSFDRLERQTNLRHFIDSRNQKRRHPIKFRILSYKKQLNVNVVRNRGANLAQSDLLVFVEDDTIIKDLNSFSRILEHASCFDFGFGAKRLWTTVDWFQKHSEELLDNIKAKDYKELVANSGEIHQSYRHLSDGDFFNTVQSYSFIANFGFVRKSAFQKAKGFPIYRHLDLSDDCLMYRLFNNDFRFKSLNDETVFHVSHFRNRRNNNKNLKKYFKELIKDGNYWCHTYHTLLPDFDQSRIIEPLGACHYDYRLSDIYELYKDAVPLNIDSGDINREAWRSSQSLSIIDFAILVNDLIHCSSIDQFIGLSMADFDNLAIVINLATQHGLINVTSDGLIQNTQILQARKIRRVVDDLHIELDVRLNQFPCDANSRYRRARLLMQRYPFVEYMRFAIIGDDDLLSLHFTVDDMIIPVVIEADERIVQVIRTNSPFSLVFATDLLDENEFVKAGIPSVNTFITDPPYTYHGALLFICRGLMLLQTDQSLKEFYVILNEHMMGRNFQKLQVTLTQSGVMLYRVVPNFSQYPLPSNFGEYHRARAFLKGIHVNEDSVKLSSSSNLYIFRTIAPDISSLRTQIVYSEVYNHYAEI